MTIDDIAQIIGHLVMQKHADAKQIADLEKQIEDLKSEPIQKADGSEDLRVPSAKGLARNRAVST